MKTPNYVSQENAAYVSALYEDYQKNPESIEFGWRKFFEGFDLGKSATDAINEIAGGHGNLPAVEKEINVLNLIHGYRTRGHLFAKTNPVRERRKYTPGNELETFGLTEADLETTFHAGVEVGLGKVTLREIRELLEQTYGESIGTEYRYIRDPEKLKWLEEKIEGSRNRTPFRGEEKKRILKKLNEAVVFETFLGTKFLGQKRFSLEGAEALIPALDKIIESGSALGIEEFVLGMGHRGRLNVLANIMHKPYQEIFSEFQGKHFDAEGVFGGDVKYHLGYSSDIQTESGKEVHLSLCPNPSHLETVDPVVAGEVRAKADLKYNRDFKKIVPILLHGDASIAGQGLVYELLQMSKLEGYRTGGTIHIVVNNQVGFTTDYQDGRSSTYCTDLAKVLLCPVFHVNADDVEAVVHVVDLAVAYRQKYQEDVFIDILGYRKYGHNEADEPKFTQPLLYKAIESHANPRDIYAKKLIAEGSVEESYPAELETKFRDALQVMLNESQKEERFEPSSRMFEGTWKGLRYATEEDFETSPPTAISQTDFERIGDGITHLPSDRHFLKKVEKLFDARRKSIKETKVLDWAMGELMAYAFLLKEGFAVRLSGEDVERGTFSHRHAILMEEDSGKKFSPLDSLGAASKFDIHNSLLSEYAVLGFEYGYAHASPRSLVLWEAQFGDFANGAQIMIDQYLASAETKWRLSNGLVLLLPHGYEGQGPEHTSARIERFMELCADNNIQVVNCTTPANFFHVLRRQLHREFRKPLIVFTPKSLLRHPLCVSPMVDFTEGKFQEFIGDPYADANVVKKVLLCSGKIYYELLEKQQRDKRTDIAIIRIEQLYPTPIRQMTSLKDEYSHAKEFIWVQEEPENMGLWPYLCRKLRNSTLTLDVIARKEGSSTATGYAKQHSAQQGAIIESAFLLRD
jgi:2-oxoglutarate dehydrogenase E1 component